MKDDARRFVLHAAAFLVVAAVMVVVNSLDFGPTARPAGHGPEDLPFACDLTRVGAGPDDMQARITLQFDHAGSDAFPHCATLTRGTALRPRPGTETLCFAHQAATPQDLWVDAAGGQLRIFGTDGAKYVKRERAPGVDAFGPVSDITYTGSCGG